jgi:Ser/Thr protein kinase RdoA (MazF antagonist)
VSEKRQVSLLRWADGTLLSELGGGAEQEFELIGGLMAKLHTQATGWEPPAGFDLLMWDADGLVGEDPVWGRFWEADGLSDDDRALPRPSGQRARRELEGFGASPDRFGLIHCDFLADNLLVDGDRITLLDFDDAGYGWHLFDASTALAMATRATTDDLRGAFPGRVPAPAPLPEDHLARLPPSRRCGLPRTWRGAHAPTACQRPGRFHPAAAVDNIRRYLESETQPRPSARLAAVGKSAPVWQRARVDNNGPCVSFCSPSSTRVVMTKLWARPRVGTGSRN